MADRLNLFVEVVATCPHRWMIGRAKRDYLVDKWGQGGYDYVGNSIADIPAWSKARHRYLVWQEQLTSFQHSSWHSLSRKRINVAIIYSKAPPTRKSRQIVIAER